MICVRFFICLAVCGVLVGSSSLLDKQHCKCRVLPEKKIVGGKQAHHLAYPWMASINRREDRFPAYLRRLVPDRKKDFYHTCGGIILNSRYVLTAAHCVSKGTKHMSVGFGGDNDLFKIFDAGRIKVKRYVIHPDYKVSGVPDTEDELVENDIAILELSSPIQFTDYLQPGCIQSTPMSSYPNGGVLSTAGFGLVDPFEEDSLTGRPVSPNKLSRHLKEVEVQDISATAKKCLADKSLVCVNSINEGESSCKGDSGSAIYAGPVNGKVYAVGITSYSDDVKWTDDRYKKVCIGRTYYARIQSFISWIESIIGEDYCTI